MVGERFEVTLWLLSTASLLALAIAVPVAIRCARHHEGFFDHITRLVGTAGLADAGVLDQRDAAARHHAAHRLVPDGGFGDTFPDKLRSIVLPAVTPARSGWRPCSSVASVRRSLKC